MHRLQKRLLTAASSYMDNNLRTQVLQVRDAMRRMPNHSHMVQTLQLPLPYGDTQQQKTPHTHPHKHTQHNHTVPTQIQHAPQ